MIKSYDFDGAGTAAAAGATLFSSALGASAIGVASVETTGSGFVSTAV